MRMKHSALVAAAILMAFPATAQIQILGSNIGQSCYDAALRSNGPLRVRERVCNEAIESDTLARRDLAATHVNRGIIRMRANDYSGAIEDFETAGGLRSDLGAIYLNKGAAYIGAGLPKEAISSLNKAIELDTQDPHSAYFNLGLAHEMAGDVENAYLSFTKALELRPDWDLALNQLERYSLVSEG